MKNKKAVKGILCLVCAFVLMATPVLHFSPVLAQDSAVSLGASTVATAAAFEQALGAAQIGVIHIQAEIDSSSLDWETAQKGGKTITGTGRTLTLPRQLSAGGALTFRDIVLSGPSSGNAVIYAAANAFRFGSGVTVLNNSIAALYGGGVTSGAGNADITLESGSLGAVYAGPGNGVLGGNARINLESAATVGAVYAHYQGGSVDGSSEIVYRHYGSDQGYTSTLPAAYGFGTVVLDNTYLRVTSWPDSFTGKLSVMKNSSLWFDGDVSPAASLHGEEGQMIITSGKTVTLPHPSVKSGAITGKFNVSINGGTPAYIRNGGPYAACFTLPSGLHVSVTDDVLGFNQVALSRIELLSPGKTAYMRGDALDLTGAVIRAYYEPFGLGITRDIPVTADMVSQYNPAQLGRQDAVITYEGKTVFYPLWVADPDINGYALTVLPKTGYYINESLELTGGVIRVSYKNGTVSDIPFTDPAVTVTGFDSQLPKTLTLQVYLNMQHAGSYTVNVRYRSYRESDDDSNTDPMAYIPDSERTVDIRGLPSDKTVVVGDSFTLNASPNRRGTWKYDDTYFSVDIDRNTNAATFTALAEGNSRITYTDESARASETIRIEDDTPPSGPRDIPVTSQQSKPAVIPPPAIVSSSAPSEPPASSSSSAPAPKPPVSEPPATQPQDSEEPEAGEEAPAQASKSRIPVAVAGVGAALSMIAVAGVCIWRVVRKTTVFTDITAVHK
ncbi:MAG: bacterial Ig-like domain-containing protein [Oscillospiraceae bacterium]|jgi:hypothetical protein|nr:bacterial Ig-like domain-containing protein [Oscillospiraceae bacterium]